jgi:hydroxyacylglutathione hydrolase
MHNNFEQLRKLDPNTRLYCGHEYTLANLRFAKSIEPNNEALQKYEQHAKELRDQGKPTVPSVLGEEFEYNPFLRSTVKSVQKDMGSEDDPVTTLQTLRKKKDSFK